MASIDLGRPLPERFFAPHRAVAAGLAIAALLAAGIWSWVWAERRFATQPRAAPPCFEPDYPVTPGREPLVAFSPTLRRTDALELARLAAAAERCTARSCDGAALREYRSAMFWYLSKRMGHHRSLEAKHGEPGLERARFNYRTPADEAIGRGLRERSDAGLFRLSDWRQQPEAIAMLALDGGRAMRACRATDRTG